jgi:hypothetical protein
VTRLIDRYGASKPLSELAGVLAADCPKRVSKSFFHRCGVYFPEWERRAV